MPNNKNILLGYSGHAYVVLETARKAGISIPYYADKEKVANNPYGLEYLGFEGDKDFKGWYSSYGFVLGVGDNNIRAKLAGLVQEHGQKLLSVIDPSSEISDSAKIGKGSFLASQVTVNALTEIGNFAILNTACIVEHECIIQNGAHIAPGAVLAGNVTVGKESFIGANAVIIEGVNIGRNVIIGAGSTIIEDVPNGKKVVGNPGKEI